MVTRCHSWSLVAIGCTTRGHSLSLDVPLVCLFINNLQVLRKKQNIRLHVTKIGNGKQDE